jgi:hypothetical protein
MVGYRPGEFMDYCVLGDDIVIANHAVGYAYVDVIRSFGVEINLSKSLRTMQDSRMCLEFAKRFIVNGVDASPISMKQLVSSNSLAARVQNLLYFGFKGLVQTFSMFAVILARYPSDGKITTSSVMKKSGFHHGLVGCLGNLYRKGWITLDMLVEACANPEDPEFDFSEKDAFSVPSAQVMSLLRKVFTYRDGDDTFGYPFSHKEEREEYRKDLVLAKDLCLIALHARKQLAEDYDNIVDRFAARIVGGAGHSGDKFAWPNLMKTDRISAAQIRSVAELILVGNKDPQEYYESLLEKLDSAHFNPSLDEGLRVSEETMLYIASFSIQASPRRARAEDEAWIALRLLRSGWPGVKYWENPVVTPWSGWPTEEKTP